MALTRILRLSNSPPFNNCRRTFFTALNQTRVVFPITIYRDSKTCSIRFIGSFIRQFSTSPMVSDDMQKSATDDLVYCVNSLRMDVETLRTLVSILNEVVSTIQKSNAQAQSIVDEKGEGNDYVGEPVMNDDKMITRIGDVEGSNEKATEKMSDFSQAMATQFNTNIVISQEHKAAEKMSDLSEKRQRSYTGDNNEKSAYSQAMATHFNTRIVISQNNKAAEKTSDVAEEIQSRDTEKLAAEKTSHFSEEIQRRDPEGNNEKAAEKMSDLCEAIATHDTDIQKCDTEEGSNKTVPECKEQDPLLKEIESDISRAVDFSCVTSQGVNFPDDFPFKLENDVPGVASITLKRRYKLENIVVTVSKPSIYSPITAASYQYYKNSSFIMRLHVEIFSVIKGPDIAFDCSVYSTGLLIENVYGCDRGDTKGLVFRELNSDLKTEFKKYLEKRGITPSITNIIFGYMLDKVNREKLRSLSKFKELVEA